MDNLDAFFALPYNQRRLATFLPPSDFIPVSKGCLAILYAVFGFGAVALSVNGMWYLGIPVGFVALCIMGSSNKADKTRLVGISPIDTTFASRFILPPGHPRPNVVFGGHPGIPFRYYPLAEFHRHTFEHKFSEVLSILMHLGVQKIEVKHIQGWGGEFAERLALSAQSIDLSHHAKIKSSRESSILFEAEFQNDIAPSLPPDLVWYPHESTWQQVADGRLKFGLLKFSLKLQYLEDYGVNLGLKASVEKAGFELGGNFEQHQSTIWEIHGTFNPLR